jgi:hypothetical protein
MVKSWTKKGYSKGKREELCEKTYYEKEERREGMKEPITGFPRGPKLTGYSEVLPWFISRQSGKRRDGRINYVTVILTNIIVKFPYSILHFLLRSQNVFLHDILHQKFLFSLSAGTCVPFSSPQRFI